MTPRSSARAASDFLNPVPLSRDITYKAGMSENASLELARDLVRLPSVNPDYDPHSPAEINVARHIVEWAAKNHLDCREQPVIDDRANLILTIRNGADRPHVHFNGHMDTVAVDGMTIDPFGGDVHNGRLWGRGSADMKGPLACMLTAARNLRDTPDSWRGTLSVGCMVDEETRFRGVNRMVEDFTPPDYAIVGEPTSLGVVRGCKGVLRFGIVVRGRAVHSSRPAEGRNAIVGMARIIPVLDGWFREELSRTNHPDFGPSTGSIGLIEGGAGVNIVPEECRIQIDVRLLPGQDWTSVMDKVKELAAAAVADLDGIDCEVEPPCLIDTGLELPADHPLVETALKATGTERSSVVFYGCDGSKIAAKGVPTIILGPGDIAQAHTADEFIELDQLEKAPGVYETLAKALMPAC